MGEHEEWPQLNGLVPNGLLPNESASVIRVLDADRWSKAEERTAELIACIQPNQPSEDRRNAVADYVQRLIMKCFPCQVFTFGSVPLKTYLPDGDIDLTAFSKNQTLKDTWASQVRDILESEEKNENAEFHVKEVQYIQAEVKIIKCLVENIVVDISFNQLGGLCTLCFLEEVDYLINQNHLFKRSIILIKAWCYYESRILGAHHGLISTYALETLVLYIFHVFNNSFAGPLEVLYRFLEFFSKFDWDNFCVSLFGPVPVSSLPDVTAEPPRKDGGELLLSKRFLESCSSAYAVFPGGQESQGQPFISKHFNVIDPLRVNNNLGRSVSKGNFYRIRSAFAFGAKRLARLLECPKENLAFELNQFFMNTWERHGSGIRPDAPMSDLRRLRPSDQDHALDNHGKALSGKKLNEKNASIHEIEVESQHCSYSLETASKSNDVPAASRTQGQKGNSNQSEQIRHEVQGKYLFARTRSSPELTDAYCDASSRARHNKPAESGKTQVTSVKLDGSRRKKMVSETVSTQSTVSSSDDPSNSISNSYLDDHASVMGAQGMHQEEQDLINMMTSSSSHHPMNLGSTHLPVPIPPSVLASLGYAQRSMSGMVPANIPLNLIDPHWATNLQFHQGLMTSPLTPYFPGVGLSTGSDDSVDQCQDVDTECWHDRDVASNGGFGSDDGSLEMLHVDDRQPSSSTNTNFVSSSDDRVSSARFSSARAMKVARDKRGRKTITSTGAPPHAYGKGKNMYEHNTTAEADDESSDWNTVSSMGNEIDERSPISQSASTLHVPSPIFYAAGPPVPFITLLYNYPTDASSSHLGRGHGPDNNDAGQNTGQYILNPHGSMRRATVTELSEEPNCDILNSDFISHFQNLQYGRCCQSPRFPAPVVCPSSPVVVPPMYLQGRLPWDGPGRPLSPNVNILSQLMNYGPHFLPVAPLQSVSNRPSTVYQRYADELPRYCSGTGTYLPKASVRDRHSSGTRRNNYNYDRSDHGDREGNWNTAKSRAAAGRSHNRSQADKSRVDRLTANENRASDRPWMTYRHEPLPPYQSQNGPVRPGSSQIGSASVAYGMYPVVYPYDQNSGYVSPGEQLEFGSLGPVGVVSTADASQPADAARVRVPFENQRFRRSSAQESSPDQPSSPHFQSRRI